MMAAYFAMRIEMKKLNYTKVIAHYPQFKDEILEILAADGYEIDEDGWAKKVEA